MKTEATKIEAASRPEAVVPEAGAPVFGASLEAMQDAEEIWGDMPPSDYVALMRWIAFEANYRAAAYLGTQPDVAPPQAALPEAAAHIYSAVLAAMAPVEPISPALSREEYVAVMRAIAAEATNRAAVCARNFGVRDASKKRPFTETPL